MRQKFLSWIVRYGPAELLGIVTAVIGASISYRLSNNLLLSAFVGAITENIGFYGYMLGQECVSIYKTDAHLSLQNFRKILRNLFLEFGFSEILDSFVIRPFCMYWGPVIISNYALGIFAASMAANITFYILAIAGYELRKKHFED